MPRLFATIATLYLALAVGSGTTTQTENEPHASERQARAALDAFIEAWNTGHNDALRDTMNFPFVTVAPNGRMIVADTPRAFATDFDEMRARDGWHHSTFDLVQATWVALDRVNFKVVWSRHRADGTRYAGGTIFYIVTNQDGHWGLQLRSPMPPLR